MYFLDIFIPINNTFFGYPKTAVIGMGENLPKHVARQWREWCNGKGYIQTAFGKEVREHYYNDIPLPSLWLYAPDDDIANVQNVAEMIIAVFPHIDATVKELIPTDYDFKEIGYMKFFSHQSSILWPLALDWFSKQSPDA